MHDRHSEFPPGRSERDAASRTGSGAGTSLVALRCQRCGGGFDFGALEAIAVCPYCQHEQELPAVLLAHVARYAASVDVQRERARFHALVAQRHAALRPTAWLGLVVWGVCVVFTIGAISFALLGPSGGVTVGSALGAMGLVAPWNGSARLLVAHALVHRLLGGRVRIAADRVGEGVWFAQGFSRHVAREVLASLGLLADEEIVAELNALEAVLATSPLRTVSNRAAVEHGSLNAVALVTARGALYAARLRARIERHEGSRHGLRELLMTWVRQAEEMPAIELDTWERMIDERAGFDEVVVFRAAVLEGRPFDVPADAFGPCFRPTRGLHVPFELGFDDPGFVGEPMVVDTVDPGGPAYAGGLRPGDSIVELSYRVGDPTVFVEAVVERGGERTSLRWLPRGQPARGRRWIRDARVPDEAC